MKKAKTLGTQIGKYHAGGNLSIITGRNDKRNQNILLTIIRVKLACLPKSKWIHDSRIYIYLS